MTTATFEGYADSLAYIEAHDRDAQKLSRTSRQDLRVLWQDELAQRNIRSLSGGPVTKDELVPAILEYRFPRWKEAVEQRAAELNRREHENNVQSMAHRLGVVQDDFLAEVLRAAHPAARERLRRMLAEIEG